MGVHPDSDAPSIRRSDYRTFSMVLGAGKSNSLCRMHCIIRFISDFQYPSIHGALYRKCSVFKRSVQVLNADVDMNIHKIELTPQSG